MISQNSKKCFFYSAIAAILAIGLLVMSEEIVKSQRAEDTQPSPFKFKRLPVPKKDFPNNLSASTSAGELLGKWTSDFGSIENAHAVAAQTDGKIVVAGNAVVFGNNNFRDGDFAVFRYNVDGSLDTSFDGDGKVTTPISNNHPYYDRANAVAIQSDGKIIAAGYGSRSGGAYGAALVRYNTDGSLDASFGAGGKVFTDQVWGIYEIAIQPDGKVVAASFPFTITRFNPNGSLDTSFGTGGIVTTSFGEYDVAYSVAIQADGKIVAAGETGYDVGDNSFVDFAMARYNTNGSLDTSFDGDGKLTTDFGSIEGAWAVALQADGKIVAAGHATNGSSRDFAFARYNGDGSLDTSFDGDGKVTTNLGNGWAISIALQSNGRIVASGYSSSVIPDVDFALVRLNTDGSLDTSFDGDGKLTTDFGNGSSSANDVAVQTDGKLIAAGDSSGNGDADFALARYNADGSLDTSFDGDGKVTTSLNISSSANAIVIDERPGFAPATFFVGHANGEFAIARDDGRKTTTRIGNWDTAYAAAIDPSGRIIAAGSRDGDFALVRYFSNLALDTSFDGDGKVITNFYGDNDAVTAVAVQADNKIVALGSMDLYGREDLALARYNDNGSLDASFGTGGRVITPAIQNPKAMAIQPDGKILAAGYAPHTIAPFGDNFAVARFNVDGSLDTSFDGDGIAVTRFDQFSRISALALQPNGKIVAAGYTAGSNFSMFALARYNADGSLDSSFDGDGKITTSVYGVFSSASAVRVQRNGKIVAVGSVLEEFGNDFALARYNPDGSLDPTFDTDGLQTTDFFGSDDYAFAAAIKRNGTIVAAGSAAHDGKTDFAVAHYGGDAVQTKVPYDFDGDGLADLSVFRPSNSVWYLNRSTQGFTATQWGLSTDKITPADFDGDGRTDISVYRDGTWYWLNSSTNSFNAVQFGLPGDIPVPADYTGDGRSELAVYRGGEWWMLNLFNNQASVIQFGLATDKPLVGDYDGDGRTDQAVYRGSGEWYLNRSSQGFGVINFGLAADKPVPADYDGDGKTDTAVYRNGTWYLLQSTNGFTAFQWGLSTDIPAPADYDGDGKTDAAVYRNGVWYLLQSANGISFQQFGLTNDKPVPAAYVP